MFAVGADWEKAKTQTEARPLPLVSHYETECSFRPVSRLSIRNFRQDEIGWATNTASVEIAFVKHCVVFEPMYMYKKPEPKYLIQRCEGYNVGYSSVDHVQASATRYIWRLVMRNDNIDIEHA